MMSKHSTTVSVIMACYNAAQYLDDAIRSVLAQTLTDFELVLIDDGSDDRTSEIIGHYAEADQRVVSIRQSHNSGPSIARNMGIGRARGKWIAILDSDDIALADRLERQVFYMERNPGTVLLASACIQISRSGVHLRAYRYPVNHSSLVRRLESIAAFPPHSSCMYSREVVKRVGVFNPQFVQSEDWDLWLRLSEEGQLHCLPTTLILSL